MGFSEVANGLASLGLCRCLKCQQLLPLPGLTIILPFPEKESLRVLGLLAGEPHTIPDVTGFSPEPPAPSERMRS